VEETQTRERGLSDSMNGYAFNRDWVKDRVTYYRPKFKVCLTYFMHDPGISYWYDSGAASAIIPIDRWDPQKSRPGVIQAAFLK